MVKLKVKHMLIGIGFIVLGIIIDQVTKYFAITYLKSHNSIKIIDGFFQLNYSQNTGGAWGILSGNMWLLILVTIGALGIFAYMMKDFDLKEHRFYSISLILIVIGTIGNFIDRVFRGYVVDFLHCYNLFGYDFPIFNIADTCLTIGVVILFIDVIFGKSATLFK